MNPHKPDRTYLYVGIVCLVLGAAAIATVFVL